MHNTRGQVITLISSSDEEEDEPAGHELDAQAEQTAVDAGAHLAPAPAAPSVQAAATAGVAMAPGGESAEVQLVAVVTRREARATAKRAGTDLTADGQPAAAAGRASKKRAVQAAPARQRPKPSPETTVDLKAEMTGELAEHRAHYLDARVRELPEEFQCDGAETMNAPALIEKYQRIHQALARFRGRRKRPAGADLTELLLLRRLRGWEAGGAARGEAAPCVDHILGTHCSF
jgi:hypothetical protein